MNNKKKVLIGIALIILIVVAIFITFVIFNKNRKDLDTKTIEAAKLYFEETLNNEVYVETLLENGYLKTAKEKCILLKKDDEIVETEKGDCKKAKEEAKKPVIVLSASNNFKLREWNGKGTTLKASLKNNGNSHYKKENIKEIEWINETIGENIKNDTIKIVDEHGLKSVLLTITFQDGLILEKRIEVKIDKEAPVVKEKGFQGNILYAIYNDLEMKAIYYGITNTNKAPDKKDMKEEITPKFECGKKYYAWSYAVDVAGNETDIIPLGEYEHKCSTITPNVSGGINKLNE